MKHLIALLAFLAGVPSCHCVYGMGTRLPKIPEVVWQYTNEPPVLPAPAQSNATGETTGPAPSIDGSLPTTDSVAAGTFARPAIGYHAGTWTIAAEGPGMASIWVYRLKDGKWQGGQAVKGSDATAGRTYGAGIAGGVTVFRFGPKGGHGTWKGPGLIMPDGKVIRTALSTGVGRLALDGARLVLMGKNAEWAYVNQDGTLGQRGQWRGLITGEKLALDIRDGTWACAMGGFSKQDASIGIGNANGCKVYSVAAWTNYPGMSDDPNWPSVLITTGGVWFASVYGPKDNRRLYVNCVTAGKLRWPATALCDLGPATMGDRCPPRLVAAQGRLWAIYEAPGRRIMQQAVPDGKAVQVATGTQPAAAVGPDGKIWVVYIDGGLKTKVLEGL